MIEELREFFGAIESKNISTCIGTVKSIDKDKCTCTVEREGELPELLDVRLNAVEGKFDNSFVVYPAEKSEVLCVIVEGIKSETAIIKYTEIESIVIKNNDAEFVLKEGKYTVKNKDVDLKIILNDTLKQLQNSKILTPAGTGNFSPADVAKFKELENKINQLFS